MAISNATSAWSFSAMTVSQGYALIRGGRRIQQGRIVDFFRFRRHSVPEAHVDLEIQPGVAETGRKLDPLARVVL
jgi:hypothetical protein